MEARARLVERLSAMGVLAEIREELETEKDVLIAIRPRLGFAMVMVVMVPVAASRVRRRVQRVRRPDCVLSRRSIHGTPTLVLSSTSGEERTRNLARSRHGKVSSSSPRCPLACTRETVSSSRRRAVQCTRSSRGRTHCEVIVRLQGHDPLLDPYARHYPLVVDNNVRVRWQIDSRSSGSSGSPGV